MTEEGVNLYATCESSKVIFQLEKSYYLQVLSEQNGMYQVAVMPNTADFPQIIGYVWIGEVDDCDQAPVTPYYPTVKITVNSHSAPVKLSPLPSAQTLVTVTNTQSMSYYGEITSYGQLWYYVYFGGTFGYVQADAVTQPVISPHPTPLPQDVVTPAANAGTAVGAAACPATGRNGDISDNLRGCAGGGCVPCGIFAGKRQKEGRLRQGYVAHIALFKTCKTPKPTPQPSGVMARRLPQAHDERRSTNG